jgi:glyoxylase-like metal-dependent hydrolase (beta-lactamase superfamily II)
MRNLVINGVAFVLTFYLSVHSSYAKVVQTSEHVWLIKGSVNGVVIEKDNSRLVIYGDPSGKIQKADMVLFTHSRRDAVWAGRGLVENGAASIVPASDEQRFNDVDSFWDEFKTRRFNDYYQQGTKILTKSIRVDRAIEGGENLSWKGISIEVIDTPGYMREALTYIVEVDGLRYAFVGDIIYGNGKLFDLYSLQDAVKEAKIGGYHGWAGRMGELINSLKRVAEKKPDIIIPVRGPVISRPSEAIKLLVQRLRDVYENYLSINAGRWYFYKRYDVLARRVLGSNAKVNWMPWAEVIEDKPPDWIVPITNSRLIISKDQSGFLIDCGSQSIIKKIIELRNTGKLRKLEGLFITHYHNDHTNDAAACAAEFKCPVYATGPVVDVYKYPGKYRLPCLTTNPIRNVRVMQEGHRMRWKEFTFTFYDFPGQTIYHSALLVEKDKAEKIFFIGDSFTPSGIDDYCLLNRNILHENSGYFYCLNLLKKIPSGTLLINQHVNEPFSFSDSQIDDMIAVLNRRKSLLARLFPWDESNYGIDERWARFYPYGQKVRPGQVVRISMVALNHSKAPRRFNFSVNVPLEFGVKPKTASIVVSSLAEKKVDFNILINPSVKAGTYVLTADVQLERWNLPQWTEAIIEVE